MHVCVGWGTHSRFRQFTNLPQLLLSICLARDESIAKPLWSPLSVKTPSTPAGICGSLSRLSRSFLYLGIPVKYLVLLLICYLPQLVLYLRLAAMLALTYIILKKYTYFECMFILYFPVRVHNEASLAPIALVLGVSNWSIPARGYVWTLSTGPEIP